MKKLFILLSMVCVVTILQAKNENVVNGVESIVGGAETAYNDAKSLVSTVYEDGKNLVSTVYGDGKGLIKETYPEVKEAIIAIGSAIGVAAEHVYSVLVRKFIVDGVVQLLLCLFGLFFLVLGVIKLNKYIEQTERVTWKVLFPSLYMVIAVCSLGSVDFNEMLMGLINPEFGAINYIIEYSKSLV